MRQGVDVEGKCNHAVGALGMARQRAESETGSGSAFHPDWVVAVRSLQRADVSRLDGAGTAAEWEVRGEIAHRHPQDRLRTRLRLEGKHVAEGVFEVVGGSDTSLRRDDGCNKA